MEARKKQSGGWRTKLAKWLDDCRLAVLGVVLASKRWSFWAIFLTVFVIFGTLISLLSSGSSAIDLFFAADFGGKMQILGDGFLTLMGHGRSFWDFFVNFSLAVLQALLIALIVTIFRKRKNRAAEEKQRGEVAGKKQKDEAARKRQKDDPKNKDASDKSIKQAETDGLQNAGIAAGLALLGSGCPTCGTTLITPILSSMFSTGSYAIAGTISGILTAVAFLLILWSLKKMGLEMYVIIKDEEWRKKHPKKSVNDSRVKSKIQPQKRRKREKSN